GTSPRPGTSAPLHMEGPQALCFVVQCASGRLRQPLERLDRDAIIPEPPRPRDLSVDEESRDGVWRPRVEHQWAEPLREDLRGALVDQERGVPGREEADG